MKRGGIDDLVLPGGALAYAGYYLYSVKEFPLEAQFTGLGLSGLLLVLCLIFAFGVVRQISRGEFEFRPGTKLASDGVLNRQRVLLFLTTAIGILFVFQAFGFAALLFFQVLCCTLILGVTLKRAMVSAVSCTLVGYLFFKIAIGVRFPEPYILTLLGVN